MSLKVICDKCNKILLPTDEIISFATDRGPIKNHYDFCEKCHKSFINWFNSKEDSDETICTTSSSGEIKVGDEVRSVCGCNLGVVIKTSYKDKYDAYVMWADGSSGHHDKEYFIRTGRNFPQIAQVLNLMKED